jgi:integrase
VRFRACLLRQAEERLKVGPEWCGTEDYVFSTAWGKPIHPDTVSSLMTALIVTHNDRQGEPLPHARLHDLRHYADGWVMRPAVTFPLAGAVELVLQSA